MNDTQDEGPAGRPLTMGSTVSRAPEAVLDALSPAHSAARSPAPRPLPDTSRRVLVMAIVNRTRDSFFDEGRTWALEAAVAAGLDAAAQGADLVDVGGVKFAPGDPLPAQEEGERVVPVVEQLRARLPAHVLISVDTFHAAVAREAIAAGADLVNDTTGLSDPEMAPTVAARGASLVLTHSAAAPRRPLPRPRYDDVVGEVREFLAARLERALEAGIPRERIVLDPGPDLNKSTVQTLELLRGWEEFTGFDLPLLAALSRKDVVGESLGLPKEERLEGSLAAAAWTIRLGARILRVHDVEPTVRMVRMLEVIAGWRAPAGPLVHNA
ncbi:dihydropteroate synthase [Brachybacterium saurashtrense]|uniref:Dihydropteroate synthase n=1 Tax=Brachybacterium saurashtrense TaxID=556288 RepID=A0A345YQA8_9MICO|nr:dihydropteroate synthase [Brachybacterium saurashtrense]AXK46110.1 dihydropteroate synthase [Brachybacterium saurashtrense]RRR23850.1 dihydropteroate synthase [Brachybacterium saurashtrense]